MTETKTHRDQSFIFYLPRRRKKFNLPLPWKKVAVFLTKILLNSGAKQVFLLITIKYTQTSLTSFAFLIECTRKHIGSSVKFFTIKCLLNCCPWIQNYHWFCPKENTENVSIFLSQFFATSSNIFCVNKRNVTNKWQAYGAWKKIFRRNKWQIFAWEITAEPGNKKPPFEQKLFLKIV